MAGGIVAASAVTAATRDHCCQACGARLHRRAHIKLVVRRGNGYRTTKRLCQGCVRGGEDPLIDAALAELLG